MTFYEAAIEVLRAAGRPLHYKKITEIAIKRGLLSHVGKTPELTMSTRLNQEIRKDDGTALVICTRPGVFALRAWQDKSMADTIQETFNLEPDADAPEVPPIVAEDEESPSPPAARRRIRRRRRLRHQHEEASTPQDEPTQEEPDPPAEEDPAASSTPATPPATPPLLDVRELDAGEPRSTRTRARRTPLRLVPGSRQDGLVQAIYKALQTHPYRSSLTLHELAEQVQHTELEALDPEARPERIRAAMMLDNAFQVSRGVRPHFARRATGWQLTHRGLSPATLRREQELHALADELRADAAGAVAELLTDLSSDGLTLLIRTLLERMGYSQVTLERADNDGILLTAQTRPGPIEMTTLAVLSLDEHTPIAAEQVEALRKEMHERGAHQALLLALSEASDAAVQATVAAGQTPVIMLDRPLLARRLMEHHLGVRNYTAEVVLADPDFFRALGTQDS